MASLALERYRRKQTELDALAAELDQLRQQLGGRITASYDPIVSRSGDGRGSLEAYALHLADVETRYINALDALAVLRLEAEAELALVEDDLTREILTSYYIDGMTAKGIATKTGRTEKHVFRLKAAGLEKLRKER